MSEVEGHAATKVVDKDASGGSARRSRGRLSLELVALRGKDVVGVRHVRPGGTAWVGNVTDSIARVPSRDFGGQPLIIGEVRGDTYTLHIPSRARARHHGGDGIPRLMVGPHRIDLQEGERAVLVLGPVQIRAQVVPFETPANGLGVRSIVAWAGVIDLIGAAALALSAAMGDPPPPRLDPGSMERIHQRFLPPEQHARP